MLDTILSYMLKASNFTYSRNKIAAIENISDHTKSSNNSKVIYVIFITGIPKISKGGCPWQER